MSYAIRAVNLYDAISIKKVRSALSGKVIDTSFGELVAQYGEQSYLFVYRFGSLAFFNMKDHEIERETAAVKEALGPGVASPTSETYEVRLSSKPALAGGEGTAEDTQEAVEFEYVVLRRLSLIALRLVAVTVAQSAALEYFEIAADAMLGETVGLVRQLERRGVVPLRAKTLLKAIGSAASARQHIISYLAILDPPEVTWLSAEMERLFKELQGNFDILVRFRALDRKLALVQDNITLLADLAATRRSMILEALIVVLIVIELVVAILARINPL